MWAPLCVLLLATAAAGQGRRRPVVTTQEGRVKGVSDQSAGAHRFYSFKGVPYAKPPVGPLRFQPPQRHLGWSGVIDASEHGSHCAQFVSRRNDTRLGSEDCLFANIYTRQLPKKRRCGPGLPVMVYIHGGGYSFGNGDSTRYGPYYLMDEKIVLVTFNYRLGVFGFLTTETAAAPGNYGIRDQLLLLQWVRDNIAAFGGDPNRVTIFGVSAGGISVSLLVLSPLSKGLFHRAISQSGTSLTNAAVSGKQRGITKAIADRLECKTEDISSILECIRNAPENDVMDAIMALRAFTNVFTARIDPEAGNPVIPQDPRILLETGKFNIMPWMNGVVQEEGLFFLPQVVLNKPLTEALLAGVPAAWGGFTEITLQTEPPTLDCGADAQEELAKVLDFLAPNNTYSFESISGVLTGRTFVAPNAEEVRLASAYAPVYKYLLDHRGPGRLRALALEQSSLPDLGVTHAEDQLYMFSRGYRPIAQPGTPTYAMIRFIVTLWTNFARYGYPSSDEFDMPDWPIYTEQSQQHMRLNSEPSLGEKLFEEVVKFWLDVKFNEPWRHTIQTSCEEEEKAAATG